MKAFTAFEVLFGLVYEEKYFLASLNSYFARYFFRRFCFNINKDRWQGIKI